MTKPVDPQNSPVEGQERTAAPSSPEEKERALQEGVKFDAGKPMPGLVPPDAMWVLSEIYRKGAAKYSARNWEKGMDWSRGIDALERHLLAFKAGEDYDPELQLPHIGSVAWTALALLAWFLRDAGNDDRFKLDHWPPKKMTPGGVEFKFRTTQGTEATLEVAHLGEPDASLELKEPAPVLAFGMAPDQLRIEIENILGHIKYEKHREDAGLAEEEDRLFDHNRFFSAVGEIRAISNKLRTKGKADG